MRSINDNTPPAPGRNRRGRAVLVGYGLDDDGGHVRITTGPAFRLHGGSEAVHAEMLEAANRIKREAAGLGISFGSMTREQYRTVRGLAGRENGNGSEASQTERPLE